MAPEQKCHFWGLQAPQTPLVIIIVLIIVIFIVIIIVIIITSSSSIIIIRILTTHKPKITFRVLPLHGGIILASDGKGLGAVMHDGGAVVGHPCHQGTVSTIS